MAVMMLKRPIRTLGNGDAGMSNPILSLKVSSATSGYNHAPGIEDVKADAKAVAKDHR